MKESGEMTLPTLPASGNVRKFEMPKIMADWSRATTSKDFQNQLVSAIVLSVTFYCLQVVSQRVFYVFRIHGALPGLITFPVGLTSTATNLFLSQIIDSKVRDQTNDYNDISRGRFKGLDVMKMVTDSKSWSRAERRDQVARVYIGLGVFLLLEQSMFRTSFPSSVIAPGVFANSFNKLTRSIPTTQSVVTESQREVLQRLGKRFGCHQCGSRQMFTSKVFIGDHMPPTKFAVEQSQALWRKFLRVPVTQRLWPQCQKCFLLQGSAVRTWTHKLVSHKVFRSYHLAPVIAALLVEEPTVKDSLSFLVKPTLRMGDKLSL